MAYSEKVVDHYENPRNVGAFDKGDESVGTGMVGAPACGDVMKLQIKVNPQTGVIEDARFKTYGCGSAIASSSLVTEWVKGKTLDRRRPSKTARSLKSWRCHRSRSTAPSWPKTPSRPRWTTTSKKHLVSTVQDH
jgi:nitrogen fixation NifU-like protein